jgi:hypothetical protein
MPIESGILWAIDVIRLIGSADFMQAKVMRLRIDDNRCFKPEDMVFMRAARRVMNPSDDYKHDTWTFESVDPNVIINYPEDGMWIYNSENIVQNPTVRGEEYMQMFESTDPFHEFYGKSYMHGITAGNTYKFNGNYIYTSFSHGTIDIAYDGILLDEEGFPMIPNDPSVEKAIENYIKSQYLGIMADMGKDVRYACEHAEKEYCWYVGKSQANASNMSLDKRESLSNTMNRLILNEKQSKTFYRNMGHPERIRKQ